MNRVIGIARLPTLAIAVFISLVAGALAACPCNFGDDTLPGLKSSIPMSPSQVTCLQPMHRYMEFMRQAIPKSKTEKTRATLETVIKHFEGVDWKGPSAGEAKRMIVDARRGIESAQQGLQREERRVGDPKYAQAIVADNMLLLTSNVILSQSEMEYAECVLKSGTR